MSKIKKALLFTNAIENITYNQAGKLKESFDKINIVMGNNLDSFKPDDLVKLFEGHDIIIMHYKDDAQPKVFDELFDNSFYEVKNDMSLEDYKFNKMDKKIIMLPMYKLFCVAEDFQEDDESVKELADYHMDLYECKKIQAYGTLYGYDLTMKQALETFNVINDYYCTSCMGVSSRVLDVAFEEIENNIKTLDEQIKKRRLEMIKLLEGRYYDEKRF